MKKNINTQYQELIQDILENGYKYTDKKRDVTCLQIDSATLHINPTDGFPALTTKKLYWKGVVAELLWFLRGSTDIRELWEHNVHIWDADWYRWWLKQMKDSYPKDYPPPIEDAIEIVKKIDDGSMSDLGRIYGAQWRKKYNGFTTIMEEGGMGSFTSAKIRTIRTDYLDQIEELLYGLKEEPMSRRHIVNAWDAADIFNDTMALPPCHWAFECIVRPLVYPSGCARYKEGMCADYLEDECKGLCDIKYGFTLKWHQRSVDTFLGLPFNIASYALLGEIIGKLTGYKFLGLIGDLSNVHLYENAWDAARELVKRDPMKYPLPKLENITGFKMGMHGDFNQWINSREPKDFKLKDYESYQNDFDVPMLAPIT